MFVKIDMSNKEVAKNFIAREFFYPDFPYENREVYSPFYLNDALINAAQIIRTYFSLPVKITSVHRFQENQYFHFYYMAVDLIILSGEDHQVHRKLLDEIRSGNDSTLYLQLRNAGINGFGLSDSHIHLDIRQGIFSDVDSVGPVCVFEE